MSQIQVPYGDCVLLHDAKILDRNLMTCGESAGTQSLRHLCEWEVHGGHNTARAWKIDIGNVAKAMLHIP